MTTEQQQYEKQQHEAKIKEVIGNITFFTLSLKGMNDVYQCYLKNHFKWTSLKEWIILYRFRKILSNYITNISILNRRLDQLVNSK